MGNPRFHVNRPTRNHPAVFFVILSCLALSAEAVESPAPSNLGRGPWLYRTPFTVTGTTAGAQADYQVQVVLDTASLVVAGKMQQSGADIRFTNAADEELPYWIESRMNTASTRIWVRLDAIPASPGTTTLYMYYGNPTASPATDGEAVFEFFDDFEDGSGRFLRTGRRLGRDLRRVP